MTQQVEPDEQDLPELPDPDTATELSGDDDNHAAARARAGTDPRQAT